MGLPPMNLEVEVFAAQVCSLVVRKLPIEFEAKLFCLAQRSQLSWHVRDPLGGCED